MGSNGRITSEVETLSLQDLSDLIERSDGNRPRSPGTIERLAAAMVRREWTVNGEAIIIADDGSLMDGQHRVAAALQAGLPLTTMVTRGVPRQAFDTLGAGRIRSLADVFAIRGEKHHKILAPAIRIQVGWDLGLRAGSLSTQATTRQGEATLDAHPGMRDAAGWVSRHAGLGRYLPLGQVSFLLYNGSLSHGAARATKFWDSVDTGASLSADSPALMLRNRLLDQSRNNNLSKALRLTPTIKFIYAIKAWNASVTTGRMGVLRHDPNRDSFPEFAQP